MSQEDKMVNALITGSNYSLLDHIVKSEPEAHYDHYGNRGAADLYLIRSADDTTDTYSTVYEVKGNAAVREATGANEIIRQYNRMRQYFFQDEDRTVTDHCSFELCFVVSEKTVNHVCENFAMYQSANSTHLNPLKSMQDSISNDERVCFRLPDRYRYTPAFVPPRDDIGSPSDWKTSGRLGDDSGAPPEVRRILDKLGY